MNYEDFYLKHFPKHRKTGHDEIQVLCPWHDDTKSSLSINLSTGQYFCHGCGQKGNYITFAKRMKIELPKNNKIFHHSKPENKKFIPPINQNIVSDYVARLERNRTFFNYLINERGISKEIIKHYQIGYDGERVTIPIKDRYGKFRNIRRYKPNCDLKMISYKKDYGEARLYPSDQISNNELIICEGELDALCLISKGFHAVTSTNGAKTWRSTWNLLFKNKDVVICYDCDEEGLKGGERVKNELFRLVKEIRIVNWNGQGLQEKEDITDFFVKYKRTPEDFKELINKSKSLNKEVESNQKEKPQSNKKVKVSEIEASFLELDDKTIVEQIYNPQLNPPHQFVTLSDKGFEYFPKMVKQNNVYAPAGKELVEKDVVLLPSEPVDYKTDSDLSSEIQNFIHRYLDIQPFYEKLSVLYVNYSWIHDRFSVTNYLRAKGYYGVGKSRFLQTIGALSYKPMFCGGSTTSSPIFRLIELFKGTLILDEGDFKNSDLYMDIIKILNQGYMKGMPVLRSEGGNQKWTVKAYDPYGCKIIATRKKYQDQALESRMLTIEMQSTKRDDIPLILTNDFWKEAQEIRNKLLYWRFKNYGNTQLNLNHKIPGIENRLNQIIIPILSITDDQELIKDIKESIKEYQKEMVKDRGLDVEASVIEAILKFKDDKDYERTFNKIADKTNELLGYSENDRNKLTPKKAGRIIRDSLKLKTERGMNGVYVVWDDETIKELRERYGLNGEVKENGEISDYDDSMGKNPDLGFL